jgi:hypothetical protein
MFRLINEQYMLIFSKSFLLLKVSKIFKIFKKAGSGFSEDFFPGELFSGSVYLEELVSREFGKLFCVRSSLGYFSLYKVVL